MEQYSNNPPSNVLGAGLNEQILQRAIEQSGYPLQSVATDIILTVLETEGRSCRTQEEWPFVDDDQGTIRQLDSFISCKLMDTAIGAVTPPKPQGYIRLGVELLVECKQSDLPYIFFLRKSDVGTMPCIAGLPHEELEVDVRMGGRPLMPAAVAMNTADIIVESLPFRKEPPTAIAMAKAYRKGKALELSGEESFRNLALPLTKALHYFVKAVRPAETYVYFTVGAVFPVAVLSAPMVGVRVKNGTIKMTAIPWIRMVRAEPGKGDNWRETSDLISFDVVHIDFLATYIRRVLETSQEIVDIVNQLAIPIITGRAILPLANEGISKDRTQIRLSAPPGMLLKPGMTDIEFQQWVDQKRFPKTEKTRDADSTQSHEPRLNLE